MIRPGILIVDYGGQLTQLIARRLRQRSIYCEIVNSHNADFSDNVRGVILSGGPASVSTKDRQDLAMQINKWNCPILGICYGMQLIAAAFNGKIDHAQGAEYGPATITIHARHKLFSLDNQGEQDKQSATQHRHVWMSHLDSVTEVPPEFQTLATSDSGHIAAIAHDKKRIYAVQFHPEASQSEHGAQLLFQFAHVLCDCAPDWSMANYREQMVAYLRKVVGKKKVVCALSGGVDSTVTAFLLQEAIQDQLICIFVDTGLLRKDEGKRVIALLQSNIRNLRHVDASSLFLEALANIEDPEEKRKIIGRLFIQVFKNTLDDDMVHADFLAQGTLYPDVIESHTPKGASSVTIKSHHNVGGLPENLPYQLIEPLRELFKDEVRILGKELGVSETILQRHPFPGPGLAVRLPGAITQERVRILQDIDAIYLDEIRKAGLYNEIWQAFAVLLPVRSVGVIGDNRCYGHTCVLRAVVSTDGMTASAYGYDMTFLTELAKKISNQVREVSRVLYDITSKPPATIEWE